MGWPLQNHFRKISWEKKNNYILFRMARKILEQIKSYWKSELAQCKSITRTNVIRDCSLQFVQINRVDIWAFSMERFAIYEKPKKKSTPASIYTEFVLLFPILFNFLLEGGINAASPCVCQYQLQFEKYSLFSLRNSVFSAHLISFTPFDFSAINGQSTGIGQMYVHSIHSYRFGKQWYIHTYVDV